MENDLTYKTIINSSDGGYREKGSKFLSFACPVSSHAEIEAAINTIRKDHPKSRHVCYAYRLGTDETEEKAADAGEPGGSAGLPILNQLRSSELINVLIVVVRYFGGTKLGIPGLIHAYRSAAMDAIDHAEIVTREPSTIIRLETDYASANKVYQLVTMVEGKILHQDFGTLCRWEIEMPLRMAASLESKLDEMPEVRIIN